jgi:DNA repair photolyase
MDLYTTPFSITSQFSFCGLPLRLDTYRGCAFRCSYCFARYRGGNLPGASVRAADAQHIKSVFDRALNRDGTGVVAEFLQHRTPVHFGGMSDPLQPAEEQHRVTASALKTLITHQYPTVLSTRSALVSTSPYIDLLKDLKSAVVQFSFSSTVDSTSARVEPHATRPSVLLRAMETLSNRGIIVTCRWQPYIPGISETPCKFVPRIAATGCRHLAFEHLKLPLERSNPLWQEFSAGTQRDFLGEYRRAGARRDGRELILPASEKLQMVLLARSCSHRYGMTFGAADNEFQYLSDTGCCCSGVDQFPGFEGWFKHQIGYAVRQSCGKPLRYHVLAKEWAPVGSIDRYLNSRSRIAGRGTTFGSIREHVRRRWNETDAPGSPCTFYGVLSYPRKTDDQTQERNHVYKWNQTVLDKLREASVPFSPKCSRM